MSQLYGLYGFNNPYVALYHHGILGQKWGVRRYQNYDGTYTQKGLARYNKSKDAYEKAKAAHQVAKSGGDTHGKSEYYLRTQMQNAKRQMNADYKQLKRDHDADEGKKLVERGDTVKKEQAKALAVYAGANAARIGYKKFMGTPTYKFPEPMRNLVNKVKSTVPLKTDVAVNLGYAAVMSISSYKINKNIGQIKEYNNRISEKPNIQTNPVMQLLQVQMSSNEKYEDKKPLKYTDNPIMSDEERQEWLRLYGVKKKK